MAGLVGNGNLVARTKFSQLLADIIPLPATGHMHSRPLATSKKTKTPIIQLC